MTTSTSENNKVAKLTMIKTLLNALRAYWSNLFAKGYIKFVVAHSLILLIIAGVFILFMLLFTPLFSSHPTAKTVPTEQNYLNEKLTDIQGKLGVIEQSLHADNNNKSITALTNEMQNMNQHIQDVLQTNTQTIESHLNTNNGQLQQQLTTLTTTVAGLQQSIQPVTYLKPDALPFDVIAIDMIQAQQMVTLFYHDATFAIEQKEWIAGWQLMNADYAKQQVVFINHKQQQVRVQLSRGE